MAVAVLLASSCSTERIVNTSEPPVHTTRQTSVPPSTVQSNAHLVNAFDYVGRVNESTGYYFTTPSGKWRCAILTRVKAGCQSASSWQSGLGVAGAPSTVPDATGTATTPNALLVEQEGDPRFAALTEPEFWLASGTTNTLQFNKILAAAGFRCNVQETGISCRSESSGKGFTFAGDGYVPRYTEVPS